MCALKKYGGVDVLLHTFLTLELDGCKWLALCGACLTFREIIQPPMEQEAGRAPELIWTIGQREETLAHAGSQTTIAQSSSP